MGKRPGQKWAQGKLLGGRRKGQHTVTSVLTRWSLAPNYQAPETTRSRKGSKWYMQYLFRKQHSERKTQRVKLECLLFPIAELKNKSSSKACRTEEVLLINSLKKTVRSLKVGSGQSLGVGTSRGQGEECRGQVGPQSLPNGQQPRPPRHPDSRPPGTKDKGPSPLVSLPVPRDCAPQPFDQIRGHYQGLRAGSLGSLGVPNERDYAWPF